YFFFQAEDGIRDRNVTGVQTCALPICLSIIAKPLVLFLLTEKWLPCVPFLQLACISFGLQPIQTANCQAIKAIGRSDVYLATERSEERRVGKEYKSLWRVY